MGAWGHGYYEDDSALDFMAEIEEADSPKEVINDALRVAVDNEYVEAYEGNTAIAASTYVDRQLNDTKFSSNEDKVYLDVDTFPDSHPNIKFDDLRDKAVLALQKVLSKSSELNELWAENSEDYPAWRNSIEQLIQRLNNQ